MIRLALCSVLCGLTIVLALATAALQSWNRDRGIALDAIKQECDMLEAVNGDRCQRILARDWSPLALEKTTPTEHRDEHGSHPATSQLAAATRIEKGARP